MKILIIEDEKDIRETIAEFLSNEGYICESAGDYDTAEEKLYLYRYNVVILDITLPGGNGLELLKELKKDHHETGVLIVSAKNSLDDKIAGLDLGADDYIAKPFHLAELNSRIKALIRRQFFKGADSIDFNEVKILPDNKEVFVLDNPIELTKKEFDLLLYFITNKNRVLTKEALAEHMWGDNIDQADNFDFLYTHIKNLRKKIVHAGGKDYLKTVYGMGYKFSDH